MRASGSGSRRGRRAPCRLERAGQLSPPLAGAWRSGRITVSQAQALVPLVLAPGSEPFHAAWIERDVTVRRLEGDVDLTTLCAAHHQRGATRG